MKVIAAVSPMQLPGSLFDTLRGSTLQPKSPWDASGGGQSVQTCSSFRRRIKYFGLRESKLSITHPNGNLTAETIAMMVSLP
jgi:hypothetical protein